MSADDIHKAKKRRQYLKEAVASGQADPAELEQLGIMLPEETRPRTASPVNEIVLPLQNSDFRAKKRVSFASEEELVKVHLFEPYDEDDKSSSRKTTRLDDFLAANTARKRKDKYLHADAQEASFAFRQLRIEIEPEIEWRFPVEISMPLENESLQPAKGEESVEKGIQEQRERQAVSAVYFSKDDVPASPAEPEALDYSSYSNYLCPLQIPLEREGVQYQRILLSPAASSLKIDPSVFSALGMLGGVSPPLPPLPPGQAPLPAFPSLPGLPPLMPSQQPMMHPRPPMNFTGMPRPPMPGMMPFPIPGLAPFPLPRSNSGPVFPPFPPASGPMQAIPQMQHIRPPTFPFQIPGARPPPPFPMPTQPRQNLHDPSLNPRLQTKPCKNYIPGNPKSCRYGSSCLFIHQD